MKTVLFSKKATPDPELLTLKAELLAAQGILPAPTASSIRRWTQSWWNPACTRSAPSKPAATT